LTESGTPAAFSGTCTESHLPGFFSQLDQLRQKGIKDIYVISANDPFVMNAWKKSFGADPSVPGYKGHLTSRYVSWLIHKRDG
jgi:peroxiredoxin